MTIDEITKQLHISKRTVYTRLKERGIDPNSLRDEQRQLTSEGMSIIASLFPDKTFNGTDGNVLKTNENDCGAMKTVDETERKRLKTDEENVLLKTENASLKREIELLREMLDDARKQRDEYQSEASRLLTALEMAQTMQQRLLPSPEGQGSSWLARLFGRK